MKMIDVESSNVAQYGYDLTTETLRVVFKSGGVYDYAHVPVFVVHELARRKAQGESIGKWLAQAVIGTRQNPLYRYAKVKE